MLQALYVINSMLLDAPCQVTLERIAASATAVFHADSCSIHRFEPSTGSLARQAVSGVGTHWDVTPRVSGLGAKALDTGRAVWTLDSAVIAPPLLEHGIACVAAFPLKTGKREPVGVFYLYFRKDPGFNLIHETWREPPIEKGRDYRFTIVIQGPRTRLYVGKSLVFDHTDGEPLHRRGHHGFRTWATHVSVDEFRVSRIVATKAQ